MVGRLETVEIVVKEHLKLSKADLSFLDIFRVLILSTKPPVEQVFNSRELLLASCERIYLYVCAYYTIYVSGPAKMVSSRAMLVLYHLVNTLILIRFSPFVVSCPSCFCCLSGHPLTSLWRPGHQVTYTRIKNQWR
jgi:hypothetical protein